MFQLNKMWVVHIEPIFSLKSAFSVGAKDFDYEKDFFHINVT